MPFQLDGPHVHLQFFPPRGRGLHRHPSAIVAQGASRGPRMVNGEVKEAARLNY